METFFIPKVSERLFFYIYRICLIINYKNGNFFVNNCFHDLKMNYFYLPYELHQSPFLFFKFVLKAYF